MIFSSFTGKKVVHGWKSGGNRHGKCANSRTHSFDASTVLLCRFSELSYSSNNFWPQRQNLISIESADLRYQRILILRILYSPGCNFLFTAMQSQIANAENWAKKFCVPHESNINYFSKRLKTVFGAPKGFSNYFPRHTHNKHKFLDEMPLGDFIGSTNLSGAFRHNSYCGSI